MFRKEVIKASGDLQKFNSRKVYATILEAGGSKKLASETEALVRNGFHKGIMTEEILEMILANIKKEPGVAQRYDLKRAIMNLGPSGFPFEKFFGRVIQSYGYKVKVSNFIKGSKVLHEVDIVASRDDVKFMIECKYHNQVGTETRLKPAMYTYARFLDVQKNGGFNRAWLATNTKCVDVAVLYAEGVDMKITSWKYPKGESLRDLIEGKRLYPITSIKLIDEKVKVKLFDADIVVARDLLDYTVEELMHRTGLGKGEVADIISEVKDICKV